VYLPKIGWVRFIQSREVDGTVKNVTVSRENEHWYVSIQVELEVAEPVHPSNSAVGIDLGVVRFATISDGTFVAPINSYRTLKNKLAKEQKRLSRKKKLSNNWQKQLKKVRTVHSKIANVRRDFHHKLTSTISNNHAIVVLEDLRVKNMSASAKGTIVDPGKNVRAKSGLNLSILDQGFYEFRRQLEYKQHWRGGIVVAVNPANTSLRCSNCNHIAKENRLSQAEFKCVECQHTEHADLNAAKNILAAGRAVLACGDTRQTAA
jgi:putative transposase